MCRQTFAMKELKGLYILKHQFRYEYIREKQEKTERHRQSIHSGVLYTQLKEPFLLPLTSLNNQNIEQRVSNTKVGCRDHGTLKVQ